MDLDWRCESISK